MATGTSIVLIALGAILTFAVDYTVAGLDIATVGVILMIAGAIGLLVSLVWLDRYNRTGTTTQTVVDDRPVVEETRTTRRT